MSFGAGALKEPGSYQTKVGRYLWQPCEWQQPNGLRAGSLEQALGEIWLWGGKGAPIFLAHHQNFLWTLTSEPVWRL